MLRRVVLGGLIAVAAVVVAAALWDWLRTEEETTSVLEVPRRARSVLLITLDTTRADRLQPYGARDVATPTMQRLAEQGLIFRRAYSVSPITLVAHTSILTGLYPPQHGVRNNGTHYVPEDLDTLAEILADEGYRTGAFVSAAVLEKRYGLNQGFEFYDDDLAAGRERHPRMVPDRPAEATVSSALAWLDGLENDRFFAWVHFYDPHAAYSPPPPYRDRYRERLYDGEIAYMDAEIGRLLQHPRLADDQDLLILVLGDHGESLGEHGEQTHAILAYDSTLWIPWILRVTDGPTGLAVKEPVSQVDVVPTVLDLLGLAKPAGDGSFAGRSVFERLNANVRDGLYSETYLPYYTYGWAKLKVLRRGDWKYIDAPTPELYDLHRDPHELTNLHQRRPSPAHDLARDLEELLTRLGGDPERETALELDSEAADKLRSLGYLSVGNVSRPDGDRPDPKDAIDLHVGLERARSFLRDRLYRQAVRQLRAVLERDPNNLAALTDLATALELEGEIEEGRAAVEKALGIDPANPRLHLQLAAFESRRGQQEQSLKLVDRALELDPRSLEAQMQKANYLSQMQRFEDVRAVLEEASEAHGGHPRLDAQWARLVEIREGDLDAAEARLRRALEADPFLVIAYRLLGEVLVRSGRFEEGFEVYRQGLERAPDDAELHARLGLLLAERGGGAEAERHLGEAIRLSGDFRADLHVARGAWLAENGRFEEAENEYRRVLQEDPRHPDARNNHAIALYRTGKADEAIRVLEEIVAEFPRHADSHNNLAAIAVDRQDWPAAEQNARRALAIAPGLTEGWNNLGIGLDEQGKRVEAEAAYRQALELNEGYWPARFNLGALLRKSGRASEAGVELEQVIAAVPNHPDVHFELGELYRGPLADGERARAHLNAFLRIAPGHPRAAEARRLLSGL